MTDYTLWYTPTPNGLKISLCMEEMGLNYDVKWIDIGAGAQFTDEFKAVNPNSKIPVLVDHSAGDLAVFESGAILEYLAEKTSSFMPPMSDVAGRYAVKQWLYWQMAGLGPMLGQYNYFLRRAPEDMPIAKERYLTESKRLFQVLDTQLGKTTYIAGDDYSIADMACYWWSLGPMSMEEVKDDFEVFENVKRWQDAIGSRTAVERVHAMKKP